MKRCAWARSELVIPYHDQEWGTPQHDEHTFFEFLILEGAQAGLSWETILRKRDRYRRVFDRFDPRHVAKYDSRKVAQLMADPGIVRNRLKIASSITNARAFLDLQREFGSFDAYVWSFVDGRPVDGKRRRREDLPARTPLSDRLSKDLKKRGFRFVGSTICYAFLQAVGVVNDHQIDCFRYGELKPNRSRKSSA